MREHIEAAAGVALLVSSWFLVMSVHL